jgi:hypothetical protein
MEDNIRVEFLETGCEGGLDSSGSCEHDSVLSGSITRG